MKKTRQEARQIGRQHVNRSGSHVFRKDTGKSRGPEDNKAESNATERQETRKTRNQKAREPGDQQFRKIGRYKISDQRTQDDKKIE